MIDVIINSVRKEFDSMFLFNPVFLGSGRCFHTFDWYTSCKILLKMNISFVTDNFGGEGFKELLPNSSMIKKLLIIDGLLFKKPSKMGSLLRNFIKIFLAPIQIYLLRRHLHAIEKPFIFAHSTYYAFLASFSGCSYVATPQGSEVLVRPKKSIFYKWFLKRALSKACFVTVDSHAMKSGLILITNRPVHIIQNGINLHEISLIISRSNQFRMGALSIRGLDLNYQILEIINARNSQLNYLGLKFCYPFVDHKYYLKFISSLSEKDEVLGRLDRTSLYKLLSKSEFVISIPLSDSSPRTLYEAIFCGTIIITNYHSFIDLLPFSMKSRIVVVDLAEPNWFSNAVKLVKVRSLLKFTPCEQAIDEFDQITSMKKVLNLANKEFITDTR